MSASPSVRVASRAMLSHPLLPATAFVHTSEPTCPEAVSVQIRIISAATWIPATSVTTDPRFAALRRGSPNYENLLLRKLGGALVTIRGVFDLNLNGNRCSFRIESIDDGHNNIEIARVNRASTRIVILPALASIGNALVTSGMDEQVENLAQIIIASYSNADAHRVLNIPPTKTTIVHGVAGVGKATLVRAVCHTLGYNLCTLSVSMILAAQDQADDESFADINPIKAIFNKAKMSVPVVVMVKDLDLLGQDSQLDDTAKSLVIKILAKEFGDVINNEKIFVVGISRDRSKLPEVMRKSDLFQHDFPVPVPSRPQRERILKTYLSALSLQPVANTLDIVEHYAREIGQRTSGYVARDLAQVCRWATLRAMRRWDAEPRTTDHVDVLVRGMAEMTVIDGNSKADVSDIQVTWQDFEYALSISKPSQQVEFESTLPKRSWDDIGGYAAIKKRMQQVVLLPLLKPGAYANLGVTPPSGLLLYGPSGCGKTILVQALASQSIMNVITIKNPEIFSKYLGETENILRRLFAMARQIAPCIIFFDEMDSIATKREWDVSDGTSGINERVLSTLLNEMDGVEGRHGVFVIGCTNRPDQLDDAILRPGRLDQLLYVDLPNETDRKEILTIITRRVPVGSDVSIDILAQRTDCFTGADLETLFRESALRAIREDIDITLVHWRHIEIVLAQMESAVRRNAIEDRLKVFRRFQERAK